MARPAPRHRRPTSGRRRSRARSTPRARPAGDHADRRSIGLSGEGYRVRNLGRGVVGATFAGVVSALLGIGGGIIKVPLMNLVDGRPAAGRDRDQQHDDRHHRVGQRRSSTSSAAGSTRTSPDRPRSACSSARPLGSRLAPPGRRPRACACCSSSSCSTPPSRCCCERSVSVSVDRRASGHRTPPSGRIGRLLIAVTYVSVGAARRRVSR